MRAESRCPALSSLMKGVLRVPCREEYASDCRFLPAPLEYLRLHFFSEIPSGRPEPPDKAPSCSKTNVYLTEVVNYLILHSKSSLPPMHWKIILYIIPARQRSLTSCKTNRAILTFRVESLGLLSISADQQTVMLLLPGISVQQNVSQ